mmetsp:Transcript_21123/g.32502  ORF Transcript_21123/g.32502 Transcript_21123/m.32502 type:complete len:549 (+) Transcript_21123:162-1808(+)
MKSAKKPKKETSVEEGELEIVRNYLLQCNLVSKDSRALQAALKGLDNEKKRMDRDAKLIQKFSTPTNEEEPAAESNGNLGDSGVVQVNHSDVMVDDDAALMEWQDVGEATVDDGDFSNQTGTNDVSECGDDPHQKDNTMDDNTMNQYDSVLGRQLAQSAITSMSNANVHVTTPLAAIALALHTALTELDFACTGIPPNSNQSSGGFAPPIRVLPKNKFLPDKWDQYASSTNTTTQECLPQQPYVALRYRKDGIGAVVLNVTLLESAISSSAEQQQAATSTTSRDSVAAAGSQKVHVEMKPANTKEPQPNDGLVFNLEEHANFDSFSTALQGSTKKGILPALHYKQLHQLMQQFCNTFDLGPMQEGEEECVVSIPVPVSFPTTTTKSTSSAGNKNNYPPLMVPPVGGTTNGRREENIPTIDQFTNDPFGRNGDFQGDLIPGGPPGGPSIGTGGNLMGPDHPIFMGGDPHTNIPRVGGGNWMQPRFDPYGPPGGPTDPSYPFGPGRGRGPGRGHGGRGGRGRPRPAPGGSGDPNPDHQRPPSDLNNHMFM